MVYGPDAFHAFRRVPNFFDVPYEPVLKAICGRNRRGRGFPTNLGL